MASISPISSAPRALTSAVPAHLTYVDHKTGYPLKGKVDYGLYLITARETLPPAWLDGRDELSAYEAHLDAILSTGAVTILQLREKGKVGPPEGGVLYDLAQRTLAICDKYNVPLVIDDNLGLVAALPRRVGLHLGQSDIPLAAARAVLGPHRIIGISTKRVEHVVPARSPVLVDIPWSDSPRRSDGLYVLPGADYVGIGTLYPTQSKVGIPDADIIGPRKAKVVVQACHEDLENFTPESLPSVGPNVLPCVLIGGLNRLTAARSLYGATSTVQSKAGISSLSAPQGIAVISDIYAAEDPPAVARELRATLDQYRASWRPQRNTYHPAFLMHPISTLASPDHSPSMVLELLRPIHEAHTAPQAVRPIIQTLTSHVSANLSANVALGMHASPIMSQEASEASELSSATAAAVLNIGTISSEARKGMRAVGQAANLRHKPVVLDPVGVGASCFRRSAVNEILDHTQVTLIKGNAAELSTLAGVEGIETRGVDAGEGTLANPESLVRKLAQQEQCLALLTGQTDYLSDGADVVAIRNGHPWLGSLTATGCSLGVAVATGMSRVADPHVQKELTRQLTSSNLTPARLILSSDPRYLFLGALYGILYFEIAAELAAQKTAGPGSFLAAWLDTLPTLTWADIERRSNIEFCP